MIDSDIFQWFGLKTKYKCEKYVCTELTKKGITAYTPLQHVLRIYKSKKRTLAIPLISGYVFVKINRQQYIQVLQTTYVFDFIRFNGVAAPISEAEIDILKRFEGYNLPLSDEEISLHAGEEVQISHGPLIGLKGRLIRQKGKKKYIVELRVFEKNLFVEVNVNQLESMTDVSLTNDE